MKRTRRKRSSRRRRRPLPLAAAPRRPVSPIPMRRTWYMLFPFPLAVVAVPESPPEEVSEE
jgi:hypothetical protein